MTITRRTLSALTLAAAGMALAPKALSAPLAPIGDGATDNTPIVQAMLDRGERFLHFPAGRYKFLEPIVFPPGVTFVQGQIGSRFGFPVLRRANDTALVYWGGGGFWKDPAIDHTEAEATWEEIRLGFAALTPQQRAAIEAEFERIRQPWQPYVRQA